MKIVRELNTPFYLTGGTALHRYYYNLRYSDDLDLFVNSDDLFSDYIEDVYKAFLRAEENNIFKIDKDYTRKSEYHTQIFIKDKNDTQLKIDFVNDTAPHYGSFIECKNLGRIDSIENILSNKISAIFRFEAKDIVDIWSIAKNEHFDWSEVISKSKTKEVAVDPIEIFNILISVPYNIFQNIKWAKDIVYKDIHDDIKKIAQNIFKGEPNQLKD